MNYRKILAPVFILAICLTVISCSSDNDSDLIADLPDEEIIDDDPQDSTTDDTTSDDTTSDEPLDAIVLTNVSYGNNPEQVYDLYLPEGREASRTKVVVLIHGGGWTSGDKVDMAP